MTLLTVPSPGRCRSGIQQQQHQGPHGDRHGAEGQREPAGEALVQHVPRHDAEAGLHEQGHAHGVEGKPEVELDEPAGQATRAEGER